MNIARNMAGEYTPNIMASRNVLVCSIANRRAQQKTRQPGWRCRVGATILWEKM
jgi:hypothetical protein